MVKQSVHSSRVINRATGLLLQLFHLAEKETMSTNGFRKPFTYTESKGKINMVCALLPLVPEALGETVRAVPLPLRSQG